MVVVKHIFRRRQRMFLPVWWVALNISAVIHWDHVRVTVWTSPGSSIVSTLATSLLFHYDWFLFLLLSKLWTSFTWCEWLINATIKRKQCDQMMFCSVLCYSKRENDQNPYDLSSAVSVCMKSTVQLTHIPPWARWDVRDAATDEKQTLSCVISITTQKSLLCSAALSKRRRKSRRNEVERSPQPFGLFTRINTSLLCESLLYCVFVDLVHGQLIRSCGCKLLLLSGVWNYAHARLLNSNKDSVPGVTPFGHQTNTWERRNNKDTDCRDAETQKHQSVLS